jgi:DNA mismatch repair protein MutL
VITSDARIRRLPPAVADAIAAGEVIERPASVVKELCENALDAGARRIDVVVEGGGLVRIVVVDDGAGIEPDQLELAVSRHATSKIETERDLERVSTLGFRGEALASIAAVSDLRIVSRVQGSDAAARIRVRFGEVVETGAAAGAPGTCVEVCDLFTSTPARLRFLHTERAEAASAARIVADLALAHPQVAFSCGIDSRERLRTSGRGREDAVRAVFGEDAARHMIELAGDGPVRVSGLISEPRANRGTRAGMVLVVNGRRVHNRSLMVALDEANRGLLPQDRHPFGVVAVDLDPASVDVNVHPGKREVRFRDERAAFTAVQRACWSALRSEAAFDAGVGWSSPARVVATGDAAPVLSFADASDGIRADLLVQASADGTPAAGESAPSALASLRAVGQVRGEWLVAEGDDGFVLVDPHAAHEKVLYARLLEQWSGADGKARESQLLLLPALVDCDAVRMSRFERSGDFLDSCGFVVEPFGPGQLRCTAVPATAATADAERLLLGLLDTLDDEAPPLDRRHRAAALVACHSAVRFGDRIGPAEQQRLLDELMATPGGATCPHGRPTLLAFQDGFLRRAFQRPPR